MNRPEYYREGDKVDKYKAEILEQYPDLEQLIEEYANARMEQTEHGRFHEFLVGVRAGALETASARLMIEMLKVL